MKHHKILITNDDGIHSPGLRAAAQAVMDLGEVFIVAPADQQTGAGRGLTGDKKSRLEPVRYTISGADVLACRCNCSPALIVRHSLNTLFHGDRPDLLISGINYGENLGSDITCSGTVGAALEAASKGIPGIAVSKQTEISSHHRYTEQDWDATAHFLRFFSQMLLDGKRMTDVDALKIDVPDQATRQTPWKLTKVARSGYYVREIDTPGIHTPLDKGRVTIAFDAAALDPDTDIYTLAVQQQVSVAPISVDLSSRVEFEALRRLYAHH